MTRVELRQFVRDQAIVNDTEVPDALVDQYLNEGFSRVINRRVWPFAKGSEDLTSVAGQKVYPFVGSPRSIISVLDVTNRFYLRSMPFERFVVADNSYLSSTTTPTDFYFDEAELSLFPVPAVDGDLYTVWYRTAPTFAAGETEEPPWSEGYHTIIADWATSRVWEHEEDMDRADLYRARFESTMMELDRFYNIRTEDRPMIYGQSSSGSHPSNMPWLRDATNGGAS